MVGWKERATHFWAQHICIKASTYSNLLCTLRSMIMDDFIYLIFCQLVVEVQLKSQRRMKTDQISAFLKSELRVRRNSKMRLGIGLHRCMLSSKLLRSVFLSFVLSANATRAQAPVPANRLKYSYMEPAWPGCSQSRIVKQDF